MTAEGIDAIRLALMYTLLLSAPILGAGLLVGLLVSLIQAVTQIQEQTLTFVPKIIGMGVVAVVATPWVGKLILEFAERMFSGSG